MDRFFIVSYECRTNDGMLTVIRRVYDTDPLNAIITARRMERELTQNNCPDCILIGVRSA